MEMTLHKLLQPLSVLFSQSVAICGKVGHGRARSSQVQPGKYGLNAVCIWEKMKKSKLLKIC